MIKTIVCTGDSHTWGQGGFDISIFNPEVVGGEHRLIPFDNDAYVNAIRRAVNEKTDSIAFDYTGDALASLFSAPVSENCILCKSGEAISAKINCELFRLQLRLTEKNATAVISLDGEKLSECDLHMDPIWNPYNLLTFFCDKGEHTLTIEAKGADVMLYRAELYSGEYAVLNCGVGSCPSGRYMDLYFDKYVAVTKPYIMLIEGHTINDWLTRITPKEYFGNLDRYFTRAKEISAKAPVFMTVAPIGGEKSEPFSPYEYDSYIAQSRLAAEKHGLEIADANKIMNERIVGLTAQQAFDLLMSDNWHMNIAGNLLYSEIALPYILKAL